MRKSAQWTYIVVLHALVLIALARPDLLERAAAKLRLRPRPPQVDACHERIRTTYRRADLNAPDDAVVFIGDSLIQGLAVTAIAERAINYGIDGDKAAQVLQRLRDYRSLPRARTIVMAIGVNDLGSRSDQQIVSTINAIVDALPPRVPVIVSSILPKDERVLGQALADANVRIGAINERVKALCAQRPSLHFLDAASSLRDATGNLDAALHEGDGLHLNARGNALWIKALREAIAQVAPRH